MYEQRQIITRQPFPPLRESLSWACSVTVAASGVESRQSLRCRPRVRIDMNYEVEQGDDRAAIFALINSNIEDWWCPLWHLSFYTSGVVGDTTIPITNPLEHGFKTTGGHCRVFYRTSVNVGYNTTYTLSGGALTLGTGLHTAKGIGIAPLYEASLIGQRSLSGTVGSSDLAIRFLLTDGMLFDDSQTTQFNGVDVLTVPTLQQQEEQASEQDRTVEFASGGSDVIVYRDKPQAIRPFRFVGYWSSDEPWRNVAAFRRFVFSREGKTKGFLQPSFVEDVRVGTLTATTLTPTTPIDALIVDYLTASCPYLAFVKLGTAPTVNVAAVTAATTTAITLATDATGFSYDYVSLCSAMRLQSDAVEFEWGNATRGTCELQLVSTTVGAVRTASGVGTVTVPNGHFYVGEGVCNQQLDMGCGFDSKGEPIRSGIVANYLIPDLTTPGGYSDNSGIDGLSRNPAGTKLYFTGDNAAWSINPDGTGLTPLFTRRGNTAVVEVHSVLYSFSSAGPVLAYSLSGNRLPHLDWQLRPDYLGNSAARDAEFDVVTNNLIVTSDLRTVVLKLVNGTFNFIQGVDGSHYANNSGVTAIYGDRALIQNSDKSVRSVRYGQHGGFAHVSDVLVPSSTFSGLTNIHGLSVIGKLGYSLFKAQGRYRLVAFCLIELGSAVEDFGCGLQNGVAVRSGRIPSRDITFPRDNNVFTGAFSDDGTTAYVVGDDGLDSTSDSYLRIINVATNSFTSSSTAFASAAGSSRARADFLFRIGETLWTYVGAKGNFPASHTFWALNTSGVRQTGLIWQPDVYHQPVGAVWDSVSNRLYMSHGGGVEPLTVWTHSGGTFTRQSGEDITMPWQVFRGNPVIGNNKMLIRQYAPSLNCLKLVRDSNNIFTSAGSTTVTMPTPTPPLPARLSGATFGLMTSGNFGYLVGGSWVFGYCFHSLLN